MTDATHNQNEIKRELSQESMLEKARRYADASSRKSFTSLEQADATLSQAYATIALVELLRDIVTGNGNFDYSQIASDIARFMERYQIK